MNLAISFSDPLVSHDYAIEMVINLVWYPLRHKGLPRVVTRLSQDGASPTSEVLVRHTIATLPDHPREKVEIWRDLRQGSNEGEILPAKLRISRERITGATYYQLLLTLTADPIPTPSTSKIPLVNGSTAHESTAQPAYPRPLVTSESVIIDRGDDDPLPETDHLFRALDSEDVGVDEAGGYGYEFEGHAWSDEDDDY